MSLVFLLIITLSFNLLAQDQHQSQKYSTSDDIMKKLEIIDNSIKEKFELLREEMNSRSAKIERKLGQVETLNRNLKNRILRVEEKISEIEKGIKDVNNSVSNVGNSVKEVSNKIDETTLKLNDMVAKFNSHRTTIVLGFVILILISVVIILGVTQLSKSIKNSEKNIIDAFENANARIEITTNDLKTIVNVLKEQTSEIASYQKILEEKILTAQHQLEAKLEEKFSTKRRTRKTSETEG